MSFKESFGQIPIGSNFFELIEFTLTRTQPDHPFITDAELTLGEPTLFGVNVAKVREVIRLPILERSFGKRQEILGVFQLRGLPIPAIHLAFVLGLSQEAVGPSSQVLVTEFAGKTTGFVVASARRIRRVSWNEVIPPQRELFGGITGMMLDDKGRFIFILDFEKLLADLEDVETPRESSVRPDIYAGSSAVFQDRVFSSEFKRPSSLRARPSVVIVDDSATARKALLEIVRSFPCGIIESHDGEQAWQECLKLHANGTPFLVISDIEMPRLDGYSFARRLKADPRFAKTPFLLHSSLTAEANRARALAAGADGFIAKFNAQDIEMAVTACLQALSMQETVAS